MIIGLTGGIGSGKTKAASILKEHGYTVVDADKIAVEVRKDEAVISRLVDAFGPDILNEDNSIDKKKLGKTAFSSEGGVLLLNEIITSEVINRSLEMLKGDCVYDAPLLLEKNLDKYVDVVVVVTASEDNRIERVKKRDNLSIEEIKSIMNNQMSEDEKIARADYVIYNNGSLEELNESVENVLRDIKQKTLGE